MEIWDYNFNWEVWDAFLSAMVWERWRWQFIAGKLIREIGIGHPQSPRFDPLMQGLRQILRTVWHTATPYLLVDDTTILSIRRTTRREDVTMLSLCFVMMMQTDSSSWEVNS